MLPVAGNAPELGMPVAAVFADDIRDVVNEEELVSVYGVVVKSGDLSWVFSCNGPFLCNGDGILHKEAEKGDESFMQASMFVERVRCRSIKDSPGRDNVSEHGDLYPPESLEECGSTNRRAISTR